MLDGCSDKIVEEAAGGASVAKIFEEQDEDSFRDAEVVFSHDVKIGYLKVKA